jgi:hypothetical protein
MVRPCSSPALKKRIVRSGDAGAVFALEASRLARNGRDWHTLLGFCALVGSLIIDEDGVYDRQHLLTLTVDGVEQSYLMGQMGTYEPHLR